MYNLSVNLSAFELHDITQYLESFQGKLIDIELMYNYINSDFHLIKKTSKGGIVEGMGGSSGSSFYEASQGLFFVPLLGDKTYVASSIGSFNQLLIEDEQQGNYFIINLSESYSQGEAIDISPYLENFSNHLVYLEIWQNQSALYYHMEKITKNGGIVEGGFSSEHSSFGYCGRPNHCQMVKCK